MSDINTFQYEKYLEFKKLILKRKILKDFSEYDSLFLLKFLRARSFDLEKAITMFIDCLEWRKQQNFDYILNFKFDKVREITSVYPRFYHGTDKLGRPIYIELLSKTEFDKIFTIVDEETLITLTLQEYESYVKYRLPLCSKVMGRPIEQSLVIICVKDVSVGFAMKVIFTIYLNIFRRKNF
jgi:hypothetical protein